MKSLRLGSVGFQGISEYATRRTRTRVEGLLKNIEISWTDMDIRGILFLSGGSENEAVKLLGEDHHVMLLAFAEDNAFAAACEVKSWLDERGIPSDLFNLSDLEDVVLLDDHVHLLNKITSVSHKRIGQIGEVSPWLINSNPSPELIRNRFGHRIIKIPFLQIPDISSYPISPEFLQTFKGYGKVDYESNSRVFTMLTNLIQENKLDSIALDCFPIVNEQEITACLSLAMLNQMQIPAACEADLVSLIGMMLIHDLVGLIPWMANLSGIFKGHIELAHCTVPLDFVSDYRLTTHFETGKGLAIEGKSAQDTFTIFRLDQWLSKAFVAVAHQIPSDPSPVSCRTRMLLALNDADIIKLKLHPLGNHHLVIPGNHLDFIHKALRLLNILPI